MTAIDWNVELRRIERQFDGLPPEPSAPEARARRATELRAREQAERRVAVFGACGRLLLVALLLAGLAWWPYASRCGISLFAMLGAQGMVVIGGLWATHHSWRHRFAMAHGVALTFTAAGLVLLAVQVLPRTGHATFVGMDATEWRCDPGVRSR